MADVTKIEWTHRPGTTGCTLNPIRARNKKTEKRGWYCEKVCEACRFCYAEALNTKAGDTGGTGLPYKPSMREFADIYLDEKTLQQPLHWRSPRTIFWCSMTDAFGPWVSEQWVLRMFAICALTPEHTHIFLTKRAQAMWEHLGIRPAREMLSLLAGPVHEIAIALEGKEEGRNWAREALEHWPLPNAWLGVTAGNQQTADHRIPLLLGTPAAIRFVSCEPMLGPIDLTNLCAYDERTHGWSAIWKGNPLRPCLDWIICGGESGKNARPMHPDWARSLRDQCKASTVPFFFKQWGRFLPSDWVEIRENGGYELLADFPDGDRQSAAYSDGHDIMLTAAQEHRGAPEHFWKRYWLSGDGRLLKINGKDCRLLDGCEHTEWPEVHNG